MAHNKSRIAYWLTALLDRGREPFVMKGYTFYEHPAVKELKPLTYKIYDYMCKECSGRRDFIFPYSAYKDIASKEGFQKARAELIEKGFIEIVQNNANLRKPNLYRFSEKWKK